MAREITAGILLKLKDQFSSQIKGAGISVQGFANKAVGVAQKVNQAFSGVAGTLGTLGISIGALSAINSTINLDDRMARLGVNANASAAEVNELKRQIFETAQMPDIKLDTDSIISGMEAIIAQKGNLEFVRDNVRNIALAIQATGVSGNEAGALFSEFANAGYAIEEILPLMDDLIAQGNKGKLSFGDFAKNAPAIYQTYKAIGTSPEQIRKANEAMQILAAGTKSPEAAVRSLTSAMNELSDRNTRRKLEGLGIKVLEPDNKKLRDFSDIMFEIAAKAEEIGNTDYLGTIFSNVSMIALRAYMDEGKLLRKELVNLGDTTGSLQRQSQAMSNTTKSNLKNLQTAFSSFADKSLTGPLQKLTDLLNKLAENPEKIERAIKGITVAIGALAAVRVTAGIVSFIASLNSLQSGGGLNMSGLANAAGGAGIPVHVTNWGGSTGSSMTPGIGNGAPIPRTGTPGGNVSPTQFTPAQLTAVGISTAAAIAINEIPRMNRELEAIKQNADLTEKERGKAKGGAIGETSGRIVGGGAGAAAGMAAGGLLAAMATSALAGTALGTVAPGIGNLIGLLVGAGVGAAGYYFGGKAGRYLGGQIGETAADNKGTNIAPGRRRNSGTRQRDDSTAAFPPEARGSPNVQRNNAGRRRMGTRQANGLPDDSATALPPETQGSPGVNRTNIAPGRRRTGTRTNTRVDDLIITPQGQFSTHPDDYILAMKNPASLVNNVNSHIQNEVRMVERIPQAIPPVIVEGEIELKSELVIDDKGYRLRQRVGKNTTPYKFAVGSAASARLIQ